MAKGAVGTWSTKSVNVMWAQIGTYPGGQTHTFYHEAEDITQNVFAKLMTAIQKYEQREVPFTAWIREGGAPDRSSARGA